MDRTLSSAPPLVIAHRGASADAPENTLAAFELAHTQGADMIELDVWSTADGVLAVFHDATTERWNGRRDSVRLLTWDELSRVSIRGEPVPKLEEVCAWARDTGMPVNVELKAPGLEAAVAELLRRYGLVEQVIVSSFYPAALVAMRKVAPEIARGALMGIESYHPTIRIREAWPLWSLRRLAATAWHPAWQLPLVERVTRIVRRRGYRVNVWTVDDPMLMRRLIALGVDGIISNRPALLRQIVDETARRPTAADTGAGSGE